MSTRLPVSGHHEAHAVATNAVLIAFFEHLKIPTTR